MIRRAKTTKRNICVCNNCGYRITIMPENIHESTMGDLIATYIECPVCGERILEQLDTEETVALAEKGVKLQLLQRKGRKLSESQKKRLQSIETKLFKIRLQLRKQHWNEIYQSLNEDEKTETADQELTLGDKVTITEQDGERMNEHV